MDFENYKNLLKEKYKFHEWGKNSVNNFVKKKKFLLTENSFQNYKFLNRSPIPNSNHAYIDTFSHMSQEKVFVLKIQEFASPDQAKEGLLSILMNIMHPQLPSCKEKGIEVGDIGFCGDIEPQTRIFFVRENVLVDVSSIGKEDFSIVEFAKIINEQISSRK
jgi:hypothetical protein